MPHRSILLPLFALLLITGSVSWNMVMRSVLSSSTCENHLIVSHAPLLDRLFSYHLNPCLIIIAWIRGYSAGRSQTVVIGGEQSSRLPVVSGVSQGSVLGPLLFIILLQMDISAILLTGSRTTTFILILESAAQCLYLVNPYIQCSALLFLGTSTLAQVDSVKYQLGVTLSSDLSWSSHVRNINANAKLGNS